METLGQRIAHARLEAGFDNASAFADLIEKRAHELWRYETDKVSPRSEVLARIAKVTGVSMYWLVTGEEQPEASSEPAPAPNAA